MPDDETTTAAEAADDEPVPAEALEPSAATSIQAALLREREGYVRRAEPFPARADRIAAVDEQLALNGYETAALNPKTEKRTRRSK